MTTPITPAAIASPSVDAAPKKDSPEKVLDASKQFEALLLSQMMHSMRDEEGGWLGTDADDASSSAMEYAQEAFAQSMTKQGGLGLATLLAKGLTKAESTATPKAAVEK